MALAKQAPALAKPALRSHTRDRGRGRRLFPAQAFEEGEDGRLFSNLDTSLTRRPGNIVGATSLVAGTTVGAGILALPNEAQYSGFGPFTVGTIACWLYSVVTGSRAPVSSPLFLGLTTRAFDFTAGLLIAEVSLNTVCELGGGSCSMTSMANRTLGRSGSYISSAAYVFLHYAILVAYSAKGGEVLSESLGVDSRWGPVLLNTTLGALVYFTSPSQLDFANTVLVSGVVVSFIGLLGIALTSDGGIDVNNLGKVDWSHVVPSFPVMALAFVYQVRLWMVPLFLPSLLVTGVVCRMWCPTYAQAWKGILRRSERAFCLELGSRASCSSSGTWPSLVSRSAYSIRKTPALELQGGWMKLSSITSCLQEGSMSRSRGAEWIHWQC